MFFFPPPWNRVDIWGGWPLTYWDATRCTWWARWIVLLLLCVYTLCLDQRYLVLGSVEWTDPLVKCRPLSPSYWCISRWLCELECGSRTLEYLWLYWGEWIPCWLIYQYIFLKRSWVLLIPLKQCGMCFGCMEYQPLPGSEDVFWRGVPSNHHQDHHILKIILSSPHHNLTTPRLSRCNSNLVKLIISICF